MPPEYVRRRRVQGAPVAIYNRQFAIDLSRGLSILQALESGQIASIRSAAADVGGNPEQRPIAERQGDLLVVPVRGSLTQHEDVCTSYMGGTSYEWVDSQVDRVIAEGWPAVLFDVASGGGMVDGCPDLSDKIWRLRQRGVMTAAIARDCACSAAYWIGSSAERFWVTQSAEAGSIGVYLLHIDMSKAIEEAGEVWTAIYAGEDKVLGAYWKELDKDAKEYLQASVDHTYQLFLSKVARNRGLSIEKIRETRARSFPAPVAASLGLVDEIMYYEQAIETMLSDIKRRPGRGAKKNGPSRSAELTTLRRGAAAGSAVVSSLTSGAGR